MHDGGFTTAFRPKARVRPSSAPDLAVIDPPTPPVWLGDSRGLVCINDGCGERIDHGDAGLMAAAMLAHKQAGCGR